MPDNKIPERNEIDNKYKWHLDDLYPSFDAWEKSYAEVSEKSDKFAEFEGKIDIEGNDGGYVLFDYEGKRYTYYNCFVESIAEIGG